MAYDDTSSRWQVPLNDHYWTSPKDSLGPADWLAEAATVTRSLSQIPRAQAGYLRAALQAIGLDPNTEIALTPLVDPPEASPDDDASPYGAQLRWQIRIRTGSDTAEHITETINVPRSGPLLLPWPVTAQNNVFAEASGNRYAVRTVARPNAGLYLDEYHGTRPQREIGILNAPGTNGPRFTLSCHRPDETATPDSPVHGFAMRIFAKGDHSQSKRYILRSPEDATKRLVTARRRKRPARDSAFKIEPDGPAENALRALYAEQGRRRARGDGWLLPEDLEILVTRLADPTPFPARRGVRTLANQQLRLPIDYFKDTLRQLGEELLDCALHLREADKRPNRSGNVTARITASNTRPQSIAIAIGDYLAHPARSLDVVDALRQWRKGRRVQYLNADADVLLNGQPANPVTRHEDAHACLFLAHRLSQTFTDLRNETSITIVPGLAPFCDPSTYSATTRSSQAASLSFIADAVTLRGVGRVPALRVEDSTSGETRTVAVQSLLDTPIRIGESVLVNARPAPEGTAALYTIPDPSACCASATANLPLARFAEPTRIAMASGMAKQALPALPGALQRKPVIVATSTDGEPLPDALRTPAHTFRVVAIEDPLAHEDCIRISVSAALRSQIAFPGRITVQRRPIQEPDREYVGDFLADFDEVHAQTGLSRESFEKLDETGLPRHNVVLGPEDATQLYRVRHPNPEQGYEYLYGTDPTPLHDDALILRIERGRDVEERDDPADPDEFLALMLNDEAIRAEADGAEMIRIYTLESAQLDTLFKFTTPHGTKGMAQIVPDHLMPVVVNAYTGEPEGPADMSISAFSMLARMSPADPLSLRIGHLVDSRTAAIRTHLRTLADHFTDHGDGEGRVADLLGQSPHPHAQAAFDALIDSAPHLELLHLHAAQPGEPPQPLGAALGIDDVQAMTLESLQRANDQIQGSAASDTCVLLPAQADRTHIKAIEKTLGYRFAEELTVHFATQADAEAGMPLQAPAACGWMEMYALTHHGRKQYNLNPLAGRSSDPVSGQSQGIPGHNPARLGQMTVDALSCYTPDIALDLIHHSDEQARTFVQSTVANGYEPHLPNIARTPARAERTARLLLLACGWSRTPQGRIVPLSSDTIAAESRGALDSRALQSAFDPMGTPVPGGLHDPKRFPEGNDEAIAHIDLPSPIMHPLAFHRRGNKPSLIEALLGTTQKDLYPESTRGAPAGQDNGPATLRRRLRALEALIASDPPPMRRNALRYNSLNPDAFREAVDTLASHPDYLPSNLVIDRIPVLPPALRRGHRTEGAPPGAHPHRFDRAYQRILRIIDHVESGAIPAADATQLLTQAVRALHRDTSRTTFGKNGFLNNALEGVRVAVSARASILPANPAELPPTHVEIPADMAVALYRHWAEPILEQTYGYSTEDAEQLLDAYAKDPRDTDSLAHSVLERTLGLSPIILVREPALHIHSVVALEPIIRKAHDPQNLTSLDPRKNKSVRMHPYCCEGLNADFDGDAVNFFVPLSPEGASAARHHLSPANHLIRAGNGRALGTPTHAARAGLIGTLQHRPGAPRETLLALIGDDPTLREPTVRAIERAEAADPTPWQTPSAFSPDACTRFFNELHTDTDTESSHRLAITQALWVAGFKGAPQHTSGLALPAFEALNAIFRDALKHDALPDLDDHPIPPPLAPATTMSQALAFSYASSGRFQALEKLVKNWAFHPESFDQLVEQLPDQTQSLAPHARTALQALRSGGRIKAAQIVRNSLEMGGPHLLNQQPAGMYIPSALCEGIPPEYLNTAQQAGADAGVSNASCIGRSGFLGHKSNQLLAGFIITDTDCGIDATPRDIDCARFADSDERARWRGGLYEGTRPVVIDATPVLSPGDSLDEATLKRIGTEASVRPFTLRLSPIPLTHAHPSLEGATLARDVRIGDKRWRSGRSLSAADLDLAQRQETALAVRTLDRCAAAKGVCATCVGTTRHHPDRLPSLGQAIGASAATSVNEQTTQPMLGRFHLAGILHPAQVEQDAFCDAVLNAWTRPFEPSIDATPDGPDPVKTTNDARNPPKGWLASVHTEAYNAGGATHAQLEVGKALYALYREGGTPDPDPTLLRVLTHGLCPVDRATPEFPGLDAASSRRGPERGLSTGTSAERAQKLLLDPPNARYVAPLERLSEQKQYLEHHLPIVHQAAINNDLDTLRDLQTNAPERLLERDTLGRSAMFETRSAEAALILIKAGLDPSAPVVGDPRRLRPIDLITVRGLTRTITPLESPHPAYQRKALLQTVLSRISGKTAHAIHREEHIRASLTPAGPEREVSSQRVSPLTHEPVIAPARRAVPEPHM